MPMFLEKSGSVDLKTNNLQKTSLIVIYNAISLVEQKLIVLLIIIPF